MNTVDKMEYVKSQYSKLLEEKERKRAYRREYYARPEVKERGRKKRALPENKEKRCEYNRKYSQRNKERKNERELESKARREKFEW